METIDPPLPRSINADIPRVVESIVVKCMAKGRNDRYQRVDDVLEAIDGFLAGGDAAHASAWMQGMIADRPETPEQPDVETADRYLTEGGLEADIFLYRFTPDTHLVWSITCATGMGEATTSGLPFSVQEVRYALVPFMEHRNRGRLVRFGLDHGCDHLILKDTAQPWYIRNGHSVLE